MSSILCSQLEVQLFIMERINSLFDIIVFPKEFAIYAK